MQPLDLEEQVSFVEWVNAIDNSISSYVLVFLCLCRLENLGVPWKILSASLEVQVYRGRNFVLLLCRST